MVKGVKQLLLSNKSNYTESDTDLIVDEILKLRTFYANLGTDADNYGYQIEDMLINCVHSGRYLWLPDG